MDVLSTMADNWVYWAVSIFAVIAAYIDGKELRVPNKITLPMIVAGWIWSSIPVSYTHLRAPRDGLLSRMPSSA